MIGPEFTVKSSSTVRDVGLHAWPWSRPDTRYWRLSAEKRAVLIVEEMSGDPVISALFFSFAGSVLRAHSPKGSMDSKVPELRLCSVPSFLRFDEDSNPAPRSCKRAHVCSHRLARLGITSASTATMASCCCVVAYTTASFSFVSLLCPA